MKRLLIILFPLLVLLAPVPLQSQGASRAGVVVRFSDGSIHTSCVRFAEASISGLDLLQRSGLDVVAQVAGSNAAVCKIGPDGCNYPAESCLACKFGGGQGGEYWAYWQLNDGAWRYSQFGAGARRVHDGEVDGWAYGPGNVQTGVQPPLMTFDQICPLQPVVAPTAAPVPTKRPAPQPTPKPAPLATSQPSARPSARPNTKPTAQPTHASASAPTAPAPTTTPNPPTATPVPATPVATPTTTPKPTRTTPPLPTNQPTLAAAQPRISATPVAAGAVNPAGGSSNSANYVIFGLLLAAISGAVGIALWRRR